MVATIDGFATLGPRHWRARLARARLETWLARLFTAVRNGAMTIPVHSVVEVVAAHRDSDGELLSPRIAAVELPNVLRPTVAVSWYVTLLDLYGQNHDSAVFPEPYTFDPQRFLDGRPIRTSSSQGGNPATGHRCPGEDVTVELIKTFAIRLAQLE